MTLENVARSETPASIPLLHIEDFPDELLVHILSFLGPQEVADTAFIGRRWRALANDQHLWHRIFLKESHENWMDAKGEDWTKKTKRLKVLEALSQEISGIAADILAARSCHSLFTKQSMLLTAETEAHCLQEALKAHACRATEKSLLSLFQACLPHFEFHTCGLNTLHITCREKEYRDAMAAELKSRNVHMLDPLSKCREYSLFFLDALSDAVKEIPVGRDLSLTIRVKGASWEEAQKRILNLSETKKFKNIKLEVPSRKRSLALPFLSCLSATELNN